MFNREFDKIDKQFDRDFAKAKKWGQVSFIVSSGLSLGLIGFGVWVVVKILQHFGVI